MEQASRCKLLVSRAFDCASLPGGTRNLGYSDRVIRKAPLPTSWINRIHFPVAMVESRLIRRKTPLALDEELFGQKETMLAELRGVRERTLAFLEETRTRSEWLLLAASVSRKTEFLQLVHIRRRSSDSPYQAARRNLENLPNRVVSSQN
jgi:hypothetical protein